MPLCVFVVIDSIRPLIFFCSSRFALRMANKRRSTELTSFFFGHAKVASRRLRLCNLSLSLSLSLSQCQLLRFPLGFALGSALRLIRRHSTLSSFRQRRVELKRTRGRRARRSIGSTSSIMEHKPT